MATFNHSFPLAGSLSTRRMGIGADAGIDARALDWAFERGINYFYWGTRRSPGMREMIRKAAPAKRDQMIVALQSYDTTGWATPFTFRRGLRQLGLEYADVLILGKRDAPVSRRAAEGAAALREAGLVRHLCISAHDRSTYRDHIASGLFDIVMVRYNCAHPGAESEVFPLVDARDPKPSVLVYNSTRWGHLFDPAWMPDCEAAPSPTHLYRHALSHPSVDMVLTAPSTQAQLEANLEALDQEPLNSEEHAWLKRIGEHVHELNPNTNWDFLFAGRGPR